MFCATKYCSEAVIFISRLTRPPLSMLSFRNVNDVIFQYHGSASSATGTSSWSRQARSSWSASYRSRWARQPSSSGSGTTTRGCRHHSWECRQRRALIRWNDVWGRICDFWDFDWRFGTLMWRFETYVMFWGIHVTFWDVRDVLGRKCDVLGH